MSQITTNMTIDSFSKSISKSSSSRKNQFKVNTMLSKQPTRKYRHQKQFVSCATISIYEKSNFVTSAKQDPFQREIRNRKKKYEISFTNILLFHFSIVIFTYLGIKISHLACFAYFKDLFGDNIKRAKFLY